MSKTFTATEFMREFSTAMIAHADGGPDPRGQWECSQMGGVWADSGEDYPAFRLPMYRWTPGSPFAPERTTRKDVLKNTVLPTDFGIPAVYSEQAKAYAEFLLAQNTAHMFATREQAQAVADALDKLMKGEVR